MTVPTLEHVIDAIQSAVKKPGGVRAIAADMDMAPSSLGNLINPYADRTCIKLGLEQAAYIMQRTGDVTALVLLADELGCTVIPKVAVPDKDVQGEQLDDVQKLSSFQEAVQSKSGKEERAKRLFSLLSDLLQTDVAAQCAEKGQVFRGGKFVDVEVEVGK